MTPDLEYPPGVERERWRRPLPRLRRIVFRALQRLLREVPQPRGGIKIVRLLNEMIEWSSPELWLKAPPRTTHVMYFGGVFFNAPEPVEEEELDTWTWRRNY